MKSERVSRLSPIEAVREIRKTALQIYHSADEGIVVMFKDFSVLMMRTKLHISAFFLTDNFHLRNGHTDLDIEEINSEKE